jgi:glycine oxidase
VYFFNGLGSKGTLRSPWYAQAFINHLLDGQPIPTEADLRQNLE